MNGMYEILSDRSGTTEGMKEEGITAPSSMVAFYLCVAQVYLYDEITENISLHSPQGRLSAAANVSVTLLCSSPENIFLPESSFETVTQRILHTPHTGLSNNQ